jgi:hypothetical protein
VASFLPATIWWPRCRIQPNRSPRQPSMERVRTRCWMHTPSSNSAGANRPLTDCLAILGRVEWVSTGRDQWHLDRQRDNPKEGAADPCTDGIFRPGHPCYRKRNRGRAKRTWMRQWHWSVSSTASAQPSCSQSSSSSHSGYCGGALPTDSTRRGYSRSGSASSWMTCTRTLNRHSSP